MLSAAEAADSIITIEPYGVTVKVTVLVVPVGVVTLTVRAVSAAVAVIVQFAVTVVCVGVPVIVHVTPVPDTVTPVAPSRNVPVRVTGCGLVPAREPDVGAIEVRVGAFSVPVNAAVCVPAKSVTESVAVLVPTASLVSGLNCTVITQVAPGASVVLGTTCPPVAGPQVDRVRATEKSATLVPESVP